MLHTIFKCVRKQGFHFAKNSIFSILVISHLVVLDPGALAEGRHEEVGNVESVDE